MITLRPGMAELIFAALSFFVEEDAESPALRGLSLANALFNPVWRGDYTLPEILLTTQDGENLRFDPVSLEWERAMECPLCGEESWEERPEDWACGCKVRPQRDNPESWRDAE